jgi:predicted NBD/HSP70 family sugar kinase
MPAQPATDGLVLAVDVGGTHIRTAVLDDSTVLDRHEIATPHDAPHPTALMDALRDASSRHATQHAVIGLPGRVNYEIGALEYAPNLPSSWVADLTADSLSTVLAQPVLLANDADLAAVGEAYLGAGRGHADVVYLTLSTGVGAGVVLGGSLVRATRSLAEIGHVVIDRVAARSDAPATVELLGSGTALARDAASLGVRAHDQALLRLIETGDEQLASAWRDVREAVGLAAVTLAQMFSPDAIVLGGGLGRASTDLVQAMLFLLAGFGPRGLPDPISVLPAELGDDAGLLGAARWALATAGRPPSCCR